MQQSETPLVAHLRGCIDLGSLGVLVAPVTVQGKTYMALAESGSRRHDWDDWRSMTWIQQQFFAGRAVTEHNRICEVQGYQLCLPTWEELVAIHRHFSGRPPGWVVNVYWSATPSGSGHAHVNLSFGNVVSILDSNSTYVAFQVL